MIVLYSTGCPKCEVLKAKLKLKNIEYSECNSVDEMTKLGIDAVPVLCVDEKLMNFKEASMWVNAHEEIK